MEVIFKKGKEDSKQRKPIIYRVAINVISVTKEGYLVAILWPRVLIKPNDKSSQMFSLMAAELADEQFGKWHIEAFF